MTKETITLHTIPYNNVSARDLTFQRRSDRTRGETEEEEAEGEEEEEGRERKRRELKIDVEAMILFHFRDY